MSQNISIQPYSYEPRHPPNVPRPENNNAIAENLQEPAENVVGRIGNVLWCTCAICVPMTTREESICCRELANVNLRRNGYNCITAAPDFEAICLRPAALETALVGIMDIRADRLDSELENRTYRLSAYRQFTWFVHGRLGRHVRRVIPSCVVWKVRATYPEENGIYEGFQPSNFF